MIRLSHAKVNLKDGKYDSTMSGWTLTIDTEPPIKVPMTTGVRGKNVPAVITVQDGIIFLEQK